jgi:methylenetetrahydrofolate dehydrogenase (NADP+) / methenyltetrahydrofolate cyclohydrolase
MILDGEKISKKLEIELKNKVRKIKNKLKLAIILVGDDSASKKYVEKKQQKCKEIGIKCEVLSFNKKVITEDLAKEIKKLNEDELTSGVLVQLPLPSHLDSRKILDLVSINKDVDGLNSYNLMEILFDRENILPATPKGIIRLLEEYNIELKGKNVCIIGFSDIVGKPLVMMCLNRGATVSVAHIETRDLKIHTLNSDIVMTATGVAGLIKPDMIKRGTVVIDIGINKKNGKIVGDVDYENVKDKCSFITPVPGGVGPMTVISLIDNLLQLGKK